MTRTHVDRRLLDFHNGDGQAVDLISIWGRCIDDLQAILVAEKCKFVVPAGLALRVRQRRRIVLALLLL